MTIDTSNRLLSLTTALGDSALLVERFSGREQVSGLFGFSLELLSETEDIDFAKIVGKGATLRLKQSDSSDRYWHGLVGRFTQVGRDDSRYRYRAELVPWLWMLQHTRDCKIYQTLSVPDIIETVFKARGFSDYKKSLSKSYPVRDYCVQYRESDYAFVNRLMEEEGIFYYFEHSADKHTLVMADASSAIADCPDKASVAYRSGSSSGSANTFIESDVISLWMQSLTVVPGKVSLTDYQFETPSSSLLATSPSVATAAKQSTLEFYDYPGHHAQVSEGESHAALRMQEWEARQARVEGGGDCRSLAAGYAFSLTGHYRSDFNSSYLLLSVQHEAQNNLPWQGDAGHYQNRFECQPKATVFRPPRTTPKPRVFGAQSALVVGPSGEEIYTDKYGRVKLQFHWDRVGKNDDQSSCWVRVSQGWGGLGWGMQHIPRVGQEVLVEFLDGDPDQPLVSGRLYNAEKTLPYELPTNKTQSGIKTRSSPGGSAENFNELRFEDKKGEEDVYFQAEKDFHRVVKNDDDLKVSHDRTLTVTNNLTETVSEGNYSQTVTKGTHTRSIEGDTSTTINTGNYALTVSSGTFTETLEGNATTEVKTGNHVLKVDAGNACITVSKGNQTTTVSLGKISTEAMQSIELKVGANSIKIDQSGVTISGMTVKMEGSIEAQISAPMAEVKADAMLTLKGGVTMIN